MLKLVTAASLLCPRHVRGGGGGAFAVLGGDHKILLEGRSWSKKYQIKRSVLMHFIKVVSKPTSKLKRKSVTHHKVPIEIVQL